jgi:magnesium transporter
LPYKEQYRKSILEFIRKDFTSFNKNISVNEALQEIRKKGLGERIVYFYVVDDEEKLVGVLPTRRILMAEPEEILEKIMIKNVVGINAKLSVYEALEFFALYKFLAFPVVDEFKRILGIIDVNIFTEEIIDTSERKQINDVFETIGFRINEIKNASPIKAFRLRFPWLITTIISGIICAFIAGMYAVTLEQSVLIAFFLTMILGLGESVSIQSMTIAIQTLHSSKPSFVWYAKSLFKETTSSFLLGISSALFVFVVVMIWKNNLLIATLISLSIIAVEIIAAFWGLTIPTVLHRTKLDPKISSGPITLAFADISTIFIYLGLASEVFVKSNG